MATKEPDYDAMADTADEPTGALALGDDEEESDLDAEFLMHAKEAGLSEPQARAMKLAIERCVELKGSGDYGAEDDEPDADDEAAE